MPRGKRGSCCSPALHWVQSGVVTRGKGTEQRQNVTPALLS